MSKERAIAGIRPDDNICCYVGRQDPDEVMKLIEQGLIVAPVTVDKARTIFGKVFEFTDLNPTPDGDAILDKLRAIGLTIDGDNAYKRDLLDAVVGAMMLGRHNTNPPPAGHWAQRFWDIGREYAELPGAIVLPMPVMPEQPEDAIDDSWMDGYNAALRMREECQRAIEAAGPAAPVVNQQLTTAEPSNMAGMHTLDAICDLFMIGKNARTHSCVLTNVENTNKFAKLLHAIESEFFMVPGEPDDDYPDEEPDDVCLLSCWGSNQEQYVEQFRAALPAIAQQHLVAAARDILAERQRQITAEGWTQEHDDHHVSGEIADAAACYALWGGGCAPNYWMGFWPFIEKPKLAPARRLLVKAGALIQAEVERLDRAEQAKQQEQQP